MKDELTEIHGIGESKAEQIMAVVDEHGETGVSGGVEKNVRRAYDYLQDGQMNQAESFLERAYDSLEG